MKREEISPAQRPPGAGACGERTPQHTEDKISNSNIMTTPSAEPLADQPDGAEGNLQTREVNRKCDEIRTLLPELKRLAEAFGELHELLDEDDRVADFDLWCQHKFGVIPELLLEATERL